MIERLKTNLEQVRERMAAAARAAGRAPDEVSLVAVTKYVDVETTRPLIEAGCQSIGESRPQVFREKHQQLKDLDVEWHLIGHLQRNKIKYVVPDAHLIHSVDSLRLLEAINEFATRNDAVTRVLLEVNVSGESAKHGFQEAEIQQVFDTAEQCEHVQVQGLMGMGSWGGSQDDARREFSALRQLRDRFRDRVRSERIRLDELSMGMTGDFEVAISEGATLVRVGSALFEGLE